MASGFGPYGGTGKCFPIWSDLTTCMMEQSSELCEPYRRDYEECLHNKKEFQQMFSEEYGKDLELKIANARVTIRQVQEYQPKVGKEL
eukprot:gene5228-6509_t